MAKNKRQKIEISYDRTLIADLFTKGYTVAEIHTAINKKYKKKGMTLTQQQVSYDLKKIIEEWQKEVFELVSSQKAIQLKRLLHAQREALRAWEKSQGEMRKIVKKEGFAPQLRFEDMDTDNPKAIDLANGTTTTIEYFSGDPRHLKNYMDASDKISNLLGLHNIKDDEDNEEEEAVTVVELPNNGRSQ